MDKIRERLRCCEVGAEGLKEFQKCLKKGVALTTLQAMCTIAANHPSDFKWHLAKKYKTSVPILEGEIFFVLSIVSLIRPYFTSIVLFDSQSTLFFHFFS